MSDNPTANRRAGGTTNGAALARKANRPGIEQQIRARYAAELAGADICDSLRIEAQIRAEIERALDHALDQSAPRDALTVLP